jgi:hypothetical protein
MFSWKLAKEHALKQKIRKAKIQAIIQHPDFKNAHPSEARDAATGNFTELTKRVKKEFQDNLDRYQARREKGIVS